MIAFQLRRSAKIAEDDGNINRAPIERSHLLCELIVLSELSGSRTALNVRCRNPSSTVYLSSQSNTQYLQDIVKMACEETHCGILRFVPYQHLLSSQGVSS
jgi:hypothetical protein